jgi:hypothetical protein
MMRKKIFMLLPKPLAEYSATGRGNINYYLDGLQEDGWPVKSGILKELAQKSGQAIILYYPSKEIFREVIKENHDCQILVLASGLDEHVKFRDIDTEGIDISYVGCRLTQMNPLRRIIYLLSKKGGECSANRTEWNTLPDNQSQTRLVY